MAFVFHIHAFPSCETTHQTACASVDGSDWEHSCIQIASGRNRGKFGCIHRNPQVSSQKERKLSLNLISPKISPVDKEDTGKKISRKETLSSVIHARVPE